MQEMKRRFTDSWQELKSVQTLAITAMIIAVGIVLGFFTIPITESQRVGFSSLANELIALMFGPIVGSISAGIGDVVKHFMKPMGPFFPGFTISALVAGLIYGGILYKRQITLKRVFSANLSVTIVVNMFLNNIWLSMLYGSRTFWGHFLFRAPLQLVMVVIDTALFFILVQMLKKARVFAFMKSEK